MTITTTAYAVAAELGELPTRLLTGLRSAMRTIGSRIHRYIAASDDPASRTGNLRRALFDRVEDLEHGVQVVIGVDLALAPYGRVQELGGTIRPVRAQHLTVPIGEALTGKGVARFTATELFANPSSFGYTGAFSAKGVIFGRLGRDEIVPLFALKDSVTLPAREYLADGLAANTDMAVAEIERAVDDAAAAGGAA